MFLYLFILFICIATMQTKGVSQKQMAAFCIVFMAIISGFRFETGGLDYLTYFNMYQRCPEFPETLTFEENYERGYMLLTSIAKSLGISFYGWTVIHAAIFYTLLWKGIQRYSPNFGLVLLVFLYKLFFYNTFISMRQSLTVAGFFYIMHFIEERKLIAYMIGAILLSRLHNGAYLLLVLYPIAYFNLTKTRLVWLNIIFIPTMAIGLLGIDPLGPIGALLQSTMTSDDQQARLSKYFDNENLSPIGILHSLEYFVLMFFVVKNFDKLKEITHGEFVIKLFLCLLPLFTLLRASEILTREKDYFTITYGFIAGMLCLVLPKKAGMVRFFVALVCAMGFIRFFIVFDGGELMDYTMWLFESKCSFFTSL